MAWSMHGRTREGSNAERWNTPPPVAPDGKAHIDAPTAADLLNRRSEPSAEGSFRS